MSYRHMFGVAGFIAAGLIVLAGEIALLRAEVVEGVTRLFVVLVGGLILYLCVERVRTHLRLWLGVPQGERVMSLARRGVGVALMVTGLLLAVGHPTDRIMAVLVLGFGLSMVLRGDRNEIGRSSPAV
ncbi:MAG: hypothetical protein WD934_08470 [Gemmatimonadales bacterium]